MLDDIACMIGCTRTSLNVVASDKGVGHTWSILFLQVRTLNRGLLADVVPRRWSLVESTSWKMVITLTAPQWGLAGRQSLRWCTRLPTSSLTPSSSSSSRRTLRLCVSPKTDFTTNSPALYAHPSLVFTLCDVFPAAQLWCTLATDCHWQRSTRCCEPALSADAEAVAQHPHSCAHGL